MAIDVLGILQDGTNILVIKHEGDTASPYDTVGIVKAGDPLENFIPVSLDAINQESNQSSYYGHL